jgi:hypothetical protein
MTRTCTVCTHPDRESIDKALLTGESLRNIAKRFDIGPSAVFRHKEHIPVELVKANEAIAMAHSQDLLEQMRDLNERTLRILRDSEATGDSRIALAAVREARGNAELLCKMIVAMETAKKADGPVIPLDGIEIILVHPDGSKSKVG